MRRDASETHRPELTDLHIKKTDRAYSNNFTGILSRQCYTPVTSEFDKKVTDL